MGNSKTGGNQGGRRRMPSPAPPPAVSLPEFKRADSQNQTLAVALTLLSNVLQFVPWGFALMGVSVNYSLGFGVLLSAVGMFIGAMYFMWAVNRVVTVLLSLVFAAVSLWSFPQLSTASQATKTEAPPAVPFTLGGYELSPERRAQFLEKLRNPPKDAGMLRFACLKWSDDACLAASRFLVLFSEAGWKIDSRGVLRTDSGMAHEGVQIVTHTDNKEHLPPHLGLWTQMDDADTRLLYTFRGFGVPVSSVLNQEIPKGTRGIVFGIEPKLKPVDK